MALGIVRRPWGACWMVAEGGEGENPSFFPQPQNVGGGVGGVSRLRFPPGPHLRSSRFSRHPRFSQAPTKRFAKNRGGQGLPQAPGAWIPPLSPNFLFRLKPPGLKTLGCYHNPQSADLGGVGWFPKAELYSPIKGGVFAPAFQPLGRAPSPWRPGQQTAEPCIPAA